VGLLFQGGCGQMLAFHTASTYLTYLSWGQNVHPNIFSTPSTHAMHASYLYMANLGSARSFFPAIHCIQRFLASRFIGGYCTSKIRFQKNKLTLR
jgi:hypothetical protein